MTLRQVKKNPDKGIHGTISQSGENISAKNFSNVSGRQTQIDSITVDRADDGDVLAYSVDGEEIKYEATAADSTADAAQALADKHNLNGFVRGVTEVSVSGSTLEIKALEPGHPYDFEITESAHLTYNSGSSQAAQEAEKLQAGKLVVLRDGDIKLPEPGDFADKTIRVEVITSDDGSYRIILDVLGETIEAAYTAVGDSATTIATELAADVESDSPYLSAEHVTDSGEFVEITPQASGFAAFTVTGTESPGEALVPSLADSGESLEEWTQGLTLRAAKYTEELDIDAEEDVVTLTEGAAYYKKFESEPSKNDRLFVEVENAADKGKLYTTHQDGRVPLKKTTLKAKDSDEVIVSVPDKI